MKVSIIKNDKIQSYVLPKEISASYWITDYDIISDTKNLIQLKYSHNKWKVVSTSQIKILINNTYVDEAELKEYGYIYLKPLHSNKLIIMYCYPEYDKSFKQYKIVGNAVLPIGNSSGDAIVYRNNYMIPNYAFLAYNNGMWTIKGNNKPIFVNNVAVIEKILKSGDIIFIMGLIIIITGEYLVINNPNNFVSIHSEYLTPSNLIRKKVQFDNNTQELSLYNPNDYFHRSPRFLAGVKKTIFEIDPPPSIEKRDEKPMIYTIGPMLTMSLTSVMFAWQAINGLLYENRSLSSALPSIVMSIAMLSSVILWPTLSRRYDKKQRIKKEKLIREKYTEYINNKSLSIESEINSQKNTLLQNHVSLKECQDIILKRNIKLWERRITDSDFLLLRIGIGNNTPNIEIKTQKRGFTVEENNLLDMVDNLVAKSNNVDQTPICLPLTEKNISAAVGQFNITHKFINGLILRMMTFHSYHDLKICLFTNSDNEKYYQYLKMSPHCFSNNKDTRFFANNNEEIQQLSGYLDEIFNKRKNSVAEKTKDFGYKNFDSYYVVIVDDVKLAKNSRIIKSILSEEKNYGFSVIFRTETLSELPNECNCFMNIFPTESGLFENELTENNQKLFNADFLENIDIYNLVSKLANIPINKSETKDNIPDVVGFLEMYNVGKVEQLNVQEKWKKNNTFLSLQAPIGFDETGELLELDIHEKQHGPHGLIAGMTGSGKSEFIISYILSLAVQYHPNDVSFVLIDYKGGGLSGAFENNETGVKLPHLAGSITNLDVSELNRALASIKSELKRRQQLFNDMRSKLNESTMDIYKYQRLYKQGMISEPVSHLVIICDEFAELKAQRPEFMEQLISTARIGRSLGVHLILATQKPGGIVNDQIWSNSRFKICFKVQEKSDSMDVIKRSDAIELSNVGRFYLQVGYNELFAMGQSAWCGIKYIPQDSFKKKFDTSINFIDNVGNILKSIDVKKQNDTKLYGEELPNVVSYLSNVAKESGISINKLWLDKIPGIILLDNLIKKYNYKAKYLEINPIIGEYDDPTNQRQSLLTLPITNGGNTVIYGVAGSGKSMLLSTMIYSIITNHSPEEVNIYIMDFGSETLTSFSKAPQVGDVVLASESEKISYLFKQLHSIMDERKKLFVDYNGSYNYYCKKSGKVLPIILVIINGYDIFKENYDNHTQDIIKLTRDGIKYGIVFIMTTSTPGSVRYTLSQNFSQTLTLQFNDKSDYYSIIGNTGGLLPAKEHGRGLIKLDNIYEFQTATLTTNNDVLDFVEEVCKTLANNSNTTFVPKVPTLPKVVSFKTLKTKIFGLSNVPIGINKNSLNEVQYNFDNNEISIITSETNDSLLKFIPALVKQLSSINNIQLFTFDAVNMLRKNYVDGITNNNFDKIYNDLFKYLEKVKDVTVSTKIVCLIIGFGNFINTISEDNRKKIVSLFEMAKKNNVVKFILVDNVSEFKKYSYELWFTKFINKKSYIWVGPGISSQYTFDVPRLVKENIEEMNNNFGYTVKNGVLDLLKFVEDENIEIKK